MKKLNKQQRDRLKEQIVRENELLLQLRKWNRRFLLFGAVFFALTFWAFRGMQDIFVPNIPESAANVFKWIFLVLTIIFFILAILSILSYRNGKRRVVYEIEILEGKKEFPTE